MDSYNSFATVTTNTHERKLLRLSPFIRPCSLPLVFSLLSRPLVPSDKNEETFHVVLMRFPLWSRLRTAISTSTEWQWRRLLAMKIIHTITDRRTVISCAMPPPLSFTAAWLLGLLLLHVIKMDFMNISRNHHPRRLPRYSPPWPLTLCWMDGVVKEL